MLIKGGPEIFNKVIYLRSKWRLQSLLVPYADENATDTSCAAGIIC